MNRISQLRQAMGISMKEAARRLGLPYTTYVGYEKGTREPAADTLLSLADFFGVTLEYLLGREPQSIGLLPMPKLRQLPLLFCAIFSYFSLPVNPNGTLSLSQYLRGCYQGWFP